MLLSSLKGTESVHTLHSVYDFAAKSNASRPTFEKVSSVDDDGREVTKVGQVFSENEFV